MSLYVTSSLLPSSPRSISKPVGLRRYSLSYAGETRTMTPSPTFTVQSLRLHSPKKKISLVKKVSYASLSVRPSCDASFSYPSSHVSLVQSRASGDPSICFPAGAGMRRANLLLTPSGSEKSLCSPMSGALQSSAPSVQPSAGRTTAGTPILVLNTSLVTEDSTDVVTPTDTTPTSRTPVMPPETPGSTSLPMIHTLRPSRSFQSSRPEPPSIAPCLSASSSYRSPTSTFPPSPTARARRSPSPSESPSMRLESSPSKHTLDVQLPIAIQPEMVTISAKKGDRLDVVADAWHMEHDCHYEWQISFAPHDIDMSSVHAKFDSHGHLTIDVQRRFPGFGT